MATKYDHDVIVIGGGPAGSTFARVAAGAGMDVLVIDKRKEIGVPVRCGEGLGQSDIIGRDGIELPKACYSLEVEGTKICGPNGCSIEWKDKQTVGWVLERKVFDKWLCELAIEKGAQVSTYTRAIGVLKDEKGKPNGVKVTHGGREPYEIRAPLIVSAEGMESMMARQMGFKTVHSLYEVGTCYEYEMSPIDHENLIEIHLGTTVAPKGYVWVFPKADKKANVGIGIGGHIADSEKQSGIKGVAPKQVLDNFIQKRERYSKSSVLTEFGGVISIGAPINEFVKDNCMVIGTAAKQVDPIHGGGIHLAMNAGIIAAEVAVKAKAKNTYSREVLYEYEKTWRGTDGKICSDRLKLQKALEKLNDDDLNYIIGSITKNDVTAAMDGRFHDPVMKVVAGRPTLLKVLSALL